MLKILNSDNNKKNIEEIKRICANNGSSLMILGGGVYGEILSEYLRDNGIEADIKFVVDDQYITEDQINEGKIAFSTYLEKYAQVSPLIWGIYDYNVIMKKQKQYGNIIRNAYDFHLAVVYGKRVEWNYDYVMANYEKFNETYNMLSNEQSKNTIEAYLNAAVAGEFHSLFVKYKDDIPYFNDKLSGKKIEKLFDCGAFDGDSAHDFVQMTKDYECIYEFEPDLSNIEKIKKRVIDEKILNLNIVAKGVWSETTTLRFASEGKSSSSVSDEGDITIDVIKLDDMYDCFTKNSLIKMDIEGSELEALKGAQRVIKEISPALAICVYHKREDLITIPQYINSLVKPGTYNYYIGYQGLDLAELVFYAIPKDM